MNDNFIADNFSIEDNFLLDKDKEKIEKIFKKKYCEGFFDFPESNDIYEINKILVDNYDINDCKKNFALKFPYKNYIANYKNIAKSITFVKKELEKDNKEIFHCYINKNTKLKNIDILFNTNKSTKKRLYKSDSWVYSFVNEDASEDKIKEIFEFLYCKFLYHIEDSDTHVLSIRNKNIFTRLLDFSYILNLDILDLNNSITNIKDVAKKLNGGRHKICAFKNFLLYDIPALFAISGEYIANTPSVEIVKIDDLLRMYNKSSESAIDFIISGYFITPINHTFSSNQDKDGGLSLSSLGVGYVTKNYILETQLLNLYKIKKYINVEQNYQLLFKIIFSKDIDNILFDRIKIGMFSTFSLPFKFNELLKTGFIFSGFSKYNIALININYFYNSKDLIHAYTFNSEIDNFLKKDKLLFQNEPLKEFIYNVFVKNETFTHLLPVKHNIFRLKTVFIHEFKCNNLNRFITRNNILNCIFDPRINISGFLYTDTEYYKTLNDNNNYSNFDNKLFEIGTFCNLKLNKYLSFLGTVYLNPKKCYQDGFKINYGLFFNLNIKISL